MVDCCHGAVLVEVTCYKTLSETLLCWLLWNALLRHVSSLSRLVSSVSPLNHSLSSDCFPETKCNFQYLPIP